MKFTPSQLFESWLLTTQVNNKRKGKKKEKREKNKRKEIERRR